MKGFSSGFANSFVGLGHVGICHCVATAKWQLHYVCPYAAQCTQSSNFQSALQSIDEKFISHAYSLPLT